MQDDSPSLSTATASIGELERYQVRGCFDEARVDPALVVLDGFHATKHALRFGADIHVIATDAATPVAVLARELGADIADALLSRMVVLPPEEFAALAPRRPQTGVLAVAAKPVTTLGQALGPGGGPVVLLEQPRHAGNAGAVIRVAAAAGARSVVAMGELDLWSAPVIRGAAGLHFALHVAAAPPGPLPTDRVLVGLDPDGDDLDLTGLDEAVLAFGTERAGLSDELKGNTDRLFRLPMRDGVSSLNLATAVAATLYLIGHQHR